MKQTTLNGVRYHIDLTDQLDGFIENPRGTIPSLTICCNLNTRAGLETCLHEALHGCFPLMPEAKVERSARDMARLLWGLGYRHTTGDQ